VARSGIGCSSESRTTAVVAEAVRSLGSHCSSAADSVAVVVAGNWQRRNRAGRTKESLAATGCLGSA
jgi:hypothetical protein